MVISTDRCVYVCVGIYTWMLVHVEARDVRAPAAGVTGHGELGTELRFSVKAVCALNLWTIFSGPELDIYNLYI